MNKTGSEHPQMAVAVHTLDKLYEKRTTQSNAYKIHWVKELIDSLYPPYAYDETTLQTAYLKAGMFAKPPKSDEWACVIVIGSSFLDYDEMLVGLLFAGREPEAAYYKHDEEWTIMEMNV